MRVLGFGGAAAAVAACSPTPSAPARCPEGQTTCGGLCVDLQTSAAHCGLCGTNCGVGSTCSSGICSVVCTAGQTLCGSVCKTLATDPSNCGTCGHICSTAHGTSTCIAGNCHVGICDPGYVDCDGLTTSGCETNIMTDSSNCGACGHVCSSVPNASAICSGGNCGPGVCDPGYSDCDGLGATGCEVSILTDPHNCGACGFVCSSANGMATCSSGICAITCASGYSNCDGVASTGCETHVLGNDNANCGACGSFCGGGHTCQAGVCVPVCSTSADCSGGLVCSGGVCTSCVATAECPAGQTCLMGLCS